MNIRRVFKDAFAVIGKAGQGPAQDAYQWVAPLWEDANAHYAEIAGIILKGADGAPSGMWGAMNDFGETNGRWGDDGGRYMAGCEADVGAEAPEGWTKWIIPAQTYIVADCRMDYSYGEVFDKITNDPDITIIAAVHERYPDPGDPGAVELYFPVAEGK